VRLQKVTLGSSLATGLQLVHLLFPCLVGTEPTSVG
jgi:hypothetical protein